MVQDPLGNPTQALADLQRVAPHVRWVGADLHEGLPATPGATAPFWAVGPAVAFRTPGTTVSLAPALRSLNFNASQLLPGTLTAFTDRGGTVYGLPLQEQPLAVEYSVAAFEAAGVPAPSAHWTIDDFEAACELLRAAAKAGKLPKGFYGPLPPLAGSSTYSLGRGTGLWRGALYNPALWGAFALGFGGTIVRQGHFDLTDPATERGIGRLVGIARRYGPPATMLPTSQTQASTLYAGAAMQFQAYRTYPSLPKGNSYPYQFARFPKLPVHAVIPATPMGMELVKVTALTRSSIGWTTSYPLASVPAGAAAAVVMYALWAYSISQSQAALPAILPPPLADQSVQDVYWSARPRVANGGKAVGDWPNFTVVEAGWPLTGSRSFGEISSIMLTTLTGAIFHGANLSTALSDATRQLNAVVDAAKSA